MIIGLTGGIASGKSTVSNILKDFDVYIIDADKIAHNILEKGEKGYQRVINEFGERILDAEGKIDREKLGNIVFSDKKKLKKLENKTHPLIISNIKEKININKEKYSHIVIDAPLLFEVGLDKITDQDWVVYVDHDIQVKRLIDRDKISPEEAENMIKNQMSLQKKCKLADKVITNNDSIKELEKKVLQKWKKLNS